MAHQSETNHGAKKLDEESNEEFERAIKTGMKLASPSPGDEVVITGMAGCFANADDVKQYRYNLSNKVDMVSFKNQRWNVMHPEIPKRTGNLSNIEKFDAGFFGIHYRQAHAMEPMCRLLLERAFEAVLDSGFHPQQLKGTKTGVFIAASTSESERTWLYDKLESPHFGVTGCACSMLAQRMSWFLGLNGPSVTMNTACSSALDAISHAYRGIRSGTIDNALVGGANLCLHPFVSLQLARVGILDPNGETKSFDDNSNGYTRSEAACVIFIQRAKDAHRIYSQVIHTKSNSDGFKEKGIISPSREMQRQLIQEVYRECNIIPDNIDYFESHATGTKVGDIVEIMAVDDAICTKRKAPLYVGSTKSCVGHTESASGLCAVIKVVIGMVDGYLLPNINYNNPRKDADPLQKGRMVVVAEKIPWPKEGTGLAAVNGFGYGGTNCHLVLKRFLKQKISGGRPKDNLPRLVCVSGRTESSVSFILDDLKEKTLDEEFVRLLHEIFSHNIPEHSCRGFIIKSAAGELKRSLKWFDGVKPPLVLIFGKANKNWLNSGSHLLDLPLFATIFQKVQEILSDKGVNVREILHHNGRFRCIAHETVATVAIQVALWEVLKTCGLFVDYIVSYSIGVLAGAYADNVLTLEQTVLAAYHVGHCFEERELSKTKIKTDCSGDADIFKSKLIPGTKLLQYLKKIISKPNMPSSKWITNTITNDAFAEYFTSALQNTVPIVSSEVPPKSVLIEIGSESGNFQNFTTMQLVQDNEDSINSFLSTIGRLYELGYNPKLEKLYPRVDWPVSVSTPMISSLIKWNHSDDWFVPRFNVQEVLEHGIRVITLSCEDPDAVNFLTGPVTDDGTNMVATMAYFYFVWDTLSKLMQLLMTDMQIVFENVKFHRSVYIPKSECIELTVMVQKATKVFEITENGVPVVSGKVCIPEDFSMEVELPKLPPTDSDILLTTKDIYKELKLRKHNYTGIYRGLKECELDASRGLIEWTDNWTAFLESMLQLQLLQNDTRNRYLPFSIERLAIDAKTHMQNVKNLGEHSVLSVYSYSTVGITKSGSVEMRGFTTALTPLHSKIQAEPLLETYNFVPFESRLSTHESIRVNIHLLIENIQNSKTVRVVEVRDEITKQEPLAPAIKQVLNDEPLVQFEIVVLSKKPLQLVDEDITVKSMELSSESNTCSLVVISNALSKPQVMEEALAALQENGMILSRENLNYNLEETPKQLFGLNILSVHQTNIEKLILISRTVDFDKPVVVDISKAIKNLDWLTDIQRAAKTNKKLVVVAQNDPLNGILGFVNCLRLEPNINVQCIFTFDKAPKFDINNKFYIKQLKKGLLFNVFKGGVWGTYRHFLLEKPEIQCEHVFGTFNARNGSSRYYWSEGPLKNKIVLAPEKVLVHIYCSALSIRDTMVASARLISNDRLQQHNGFGSEFSGKDATGRRIMGIVPKGALASMVVADSTLIWEIPNEWSMEDAVTVPEAYATALYSLVEVARIKPTQTILIHTSVNGIEQAAINIALYYKCEIFTTVKNLEERNFIRKQFSQIPESHIANYHDTSFEQMVFNETKGKGVDIVINSLTEENLRASVRCLAPDGKFLEIRTSDSENDGKIDMNLFTKRRSFYGVTLSTLFAEIPHIKNTIHTIISDGLKTNCIKPLSRTVFNKNNVEQAFEYMSSDKSIGKVIVNLRREEIEKTALSKTKLFPGIPCFYCLPSKSYVIIGGLGGFGLELADWLVTRGAKNLALSSRQGIKTGYQALRIRTWKTHGVTVNISTADVTTKSGCVAIINDANKLGPVAGIFNLAAVILDCLFENQTKEKFFASLSSKAIATQHLDAVSRDKCPELQHFVVFSSIASGRGSAGQTNYGIGNSVMERICEQRRNDGLCGLAIQWGAIGDVGIVTKMQKDDIEPIILGTLPQKLESCLNAMDTFLQQDEPIVASCVVAMEVKKSGKAEFQNIVDAVKHIIGLRDLKTISLHSTFSELGMDSLMAVEIQQVLEKECKVSFAPHDIRTMTFARLQELEQAKTEEN